MRKSVVIGGVLAVLVLSWAVAGTSEAAYKPEYKASIVVGPAGPWGEAAIRFADLLKERTQGRINVKNYHAGQLFAVPPAPTPIGRVSRYSELHKTSGRPENAPRGNAQRASNLLPERSP